MENELLTRRQAAILKFIQHAIEDRGYGPTVREIATEFSINSPNGVVGHLRALEKKGWIVRHANKSRAIELSPETLESTRGLPLKGRVAAGALQEAVEQNQRVDIQALFKKRGTYLLEVNGDSMIEAHIDDGDYVVVQPKRSADRGDIVVVRDENGDATLKYWYPEKNRIRLQPANRRMKPIYSKSAKVLGVVVGVIRHY